MRSYLKSEEQTPTLLSGTSLSDANSDNVAADRSNVATDGDNTAGSANSGGGNAGGNASDNATDTTASAPLLNQQGLGFVAPQKLPRLKLVATRPVASNKLRLRANSRHNAAAFNNV